MKPNLIFILIDDMGWKDLSFMGSEFYESPNIDRLCSEGMRFENGYAACPVCSPSRASYLTGKYPARLHVTDWIDITGQWHPLKGRLIDAPYIHHLPDGEVTVAQALKEGGYHTWHVGKWHLGTETHYPEKFGYDVNIGGCSWGHPRDGYFVPYGIHTLPEGPVGEYLTDRITDEAIQLIRNCDEKPFFLSLCHYTVHNPIEAKAEDIERFQKKAEAMGLPMDEEAMIRGEAMHTIDKEGQHVERRFVQSNPGYAAMIWNLDQNIGRLMGALEESGRLDNTLIIFTSDNGGLSTAEGSPTCNAPASEGKGWMYEGGVRVPLFAWWPGVIPAGSICETPVTSPDYYPTFLEAAGLPLRPEQHQDGISILPLLKGEKIEERPIFWHYPHYGNQGGTPGTSVVQWPWKLLYFYEDSRLELYNLKEDIEENRNLTAEYPQKAAELFYKLTDWMADVEAAIPERNE